jgi:hypothetical protein
LQGHHIRPINGWSEFDDVEGIIAELGCSRETIKDVLGVTLNIMRPSFGDIEWVTSFSQPVM